MKLEVVVEPFGHHLSHQWADLELRDRTAGLEVLVKPGSFSLKQLYY